LSSAKMFSFCRTEFRLPEKSLISFGRDFFWSNEICPEERGPEWPTKIFFLPNVFRLARTGPFLARRNFVFSQQVYVWPGKIFGYRTAFLEDRMSSLTTIWDLIYVQRPFVPRLRRAKPTATTQYHADIFRLRNAQSRQFGRIHYRKDRCIITAIAFFAASRTK
jgi:hypothetical protein